MPIAKPATADDDDDDGGNVMGRAGSPGATVEAPAEILGFDLRLAGFGCSCGCGCPVGCADDEADVTLGLRTVTVGLADMAASSVEEAEGEGSESEGG